MKTVILLISSIVYSTAYICCPPAQYEGLFGQMGGFYVEPSKQAGLLTANADVHADMNNGKVAFSEVMQSGGQVTHVKLVQDYKKHVQYLVINDVCTKTALPGSMEDNVCIPDSAEYVTTVDYGMGALQGNVYLYTVMHMGANTTGYVVVTAKDCIPVNVRGFVQSGDVTTIVSGVYYNMTTGIKDPSVFDIPASCDHAFPFLNVKTQDNHSGSDLMKSLIEQFKHAWSN